MSKRYHQFHRFLSILWIAIVLGLAGFNYQALVLEDRVQSDILAMLPSSHSSAITAVRTLLDDTKITQQSLILIGHDDPKISKNALHQFRHKLKTTSLAIKENAIKEVIEEYHQLFKSLYLSRARLLTQDDHQSLSLGQGETLLKSALLEITSPFSPVNLKEDPFSFFTHFVKNNQQNTPFQLDSEGDLYIHDKDKTWYVYSGTMMDSTFSMETQDAFAQTMIPLLDNLEKEEGICVLKTGGIFYATAGAQQAKNEISLIGTVSTLSIMLMMLLVFNSLRPLFFALSVIATAIITGFAAVLWFFGTVHILAIVIGCTLVGITVDYALHYTCSSYTSEKTLFAPLKKLMPALPLSVLSSAAGYALLLFIPFPGIQQMALLSSVGLCTAFMSVCLWGPYALHRQPAIPAMGGYLQDFLEKIAIFGKVKQRRFILAISLLGLFGLGLFHLTPQDNIRSFQALEKNLKAQEDQIKSMIDLDASSNFITVEGSCLEDVLQLEEMILPHLNKLDISYRCLATMIPSKKRQEENHQLLKDFYKTYLARLSQLLGQEAPPNLDNLGLVNSPFVTIDTTLLPMGWKVLIHTTPSGQVEGRIMITKNPGNAPLHELTNEYNNVQYINSNEAYSQLFTTYRQAVSGLIGVVMAGIFLLLSWRTGVRSAIAVITPVILSLMATMGILSLFMALNLFHVMGFLLVLCIGIDYALFLFWRSPYSNLQRDLLLLGNGLAAMTTILSFGLLAFSQTTIVFSFGLSVFIGISLCFIVTTIFLGMGKSHNA